MNIVEKKRNKFKLMPIRTVNLPLTIA